MHLVYYFKGMLCGFVIAAPVGPVGILCVKRTLRDGFRWGLVSGLGASAADTVFGVIAAFGLHFVAETMLEHSRELRLAGGILMIGIGIYELLARPERLDRKRPRPATVNSVAGKFGSTFLLTITNPITIVSFGAVFAMIGAVLPKGDLAGAWTLVAGVFSGSIGWFASLCGFSRLFRHRIDVSGMRFVGRVSGALVLFFGIVVLLSLTGFAESLLSDPHGDRDVPPRSPTSFTARLAREPAPRRSRGFPDPLCGACTSLRRVERSRAAT